MILLEMIGDAHSSSGVATCKRARACVRACVPQRVKTALSTALLAPARWQQW